ncbi:amino acid ABC transporter substrate-binding protein [Pseudophaeobacter leonis]|uniref:amino acid ABC transporter substrate-binding protein n=1 Tax=Pseudophaeobacter leonis TaxID=1144477 RepID=UPI00111C1F22|nr:amino acid ABC transporter substrate-binding protein [Pseudophaeobacter leonis]
MSYKSKTPVKVCMRAMLAGVIATAMLLSLEAGAQEIVVLKVGVRADAAPFSYRASANDRTDPQRALPGPLYRAGYRGYMVQICDAAFRELQRDIALEIEPVPVDTVTRFGEAQVAWHVLCDPASITPRRLRNQMPTVPVYLSGIGYATTAEIPKGILCQSVAGIADNTTASHAGIRAVANSGEVPRWRDLLLSAIEPGSRAHSLSVECEQNTAEVVLTKRSHADLARALCSGEIIYYIGDLEIVRKNLEAFPDCRYELSDSTYRDERYTIFTRQDGLNDAGRAALARFRETVAAQVLQSDSSLLDAYDVYLTPVKPSRKLAAFYWSLIGRFE